MSALAADLESLVDLVPIDRSVEVSDKSVYLMDWIVFANAGVWAVALCHRIETVVGVCIGAPCPILSLRGKLWFVK
jgi:hypothetical protein